MTALTLAAAQSISIAGDVPANIQQHLLLMRAAAEHGVQLLVFPELSLTGYEPSLAGGLAIVPEDAVLMPLREMARELQLTAVVGMPIRLASQAGVLIGALVLGGGRFPGGVHQAALAPWRRGGICSGAGWCSTPMGGGSDCAGGLRRLLPWQPPARSGRLGGWRVCRRRADQ